MINEDSTHDDGQHRGISHHHNHPTPTMTQPLSNYYQRPPSLPVFANGSAAAAYPNYGYNTQNPPTNLWGPSTGANIAATMAKTTTMNGGGGGIPDNVVITNNYSGDTGSWATATTASTLSMPHNSGYGGGNCGGGMMMMPVVAPSNTTSHQHDNNTGMVNPPSAVVAHSSNQFGNNGHHHPIAVALKPQHQQHQVQHQPQPPLQTSIQPIQPNQNRAIHRINLSSIRHNYGEVQSSAAQQQCQVIVVVKADGYGHGAILTACHLVETCGASAFAVATLEEGITLRRTFQEKIPSSPKVRILVLGAPVGYPTCFDTYLHNDIELMVSGPEVAASLVAWMTNNDSRRVAEVACVAERRKEELMDDAVLCYGDFRNPMRNSVVRQISKGAGVNNEDLLKGVMAQQPSSSASSSPVAGVVGGVDTCKNDGKEMCTTTCDTTTTVSSNDAHSEGEDQSTIPRDGTTTPTSKEAQNNDRRNTTTNNDGIIATNNINPHRPVSPSKLQRKYNAATLTNVTGDDLAREVRQILVTQRHATMKATQQQQQQQQAASAVVAEANVMTTIPEPPPVAAMEECANNDYSHNNGAFAKGSSDTAKKMEDEKKVGHNKNNNSSTSNPMSTTTPLLSPVTKKLEQFFCGIEDAARASRQRELRSLRLSQVEDEIGGDAVVATTDVVANHGNNNQQQQQQPLPQIRKKLRWHALVDSGMGRLGFKSEIDERSADFVKQDPQHATRVEIGKAQHNFAEEGLSDGSLSSGSEHSGIRDTVSVIKELYDAEVHEGAPIEFYGMCTHMADANSTSTYTHDQMERFRSLLHRVRSAGIAVPSISTDNSAALLTTSLTHFDPDAILAHDTRGYVRCGGAIYGQRPAFRQLRAVSTLSATVKHVAIIKQGESVGYDRAYVAPLDVRIATLTVGFADGYPRELGNGVGKVSIRGSIFPVAGNVCMDMLMVDLGPAEDAVGIAGSSVAVGDTAVLWGPEETNVEECGDGLVPLAELAGTLKTTQSALTCGLDKLRVQRQLVG